MAGFAERGREGGSEIGAGGAIGGGVVVFHGVGRWHGQGGADRGDGKGERKGKGNRGNLMEHTLRITRLFNLFFCLLIKI